MENHNHKATSETQDHFYKGLFFGLFLGVGLIWFLGTNSGKEFIKTARKRIDEVLSGEPGMEDFEEEETSESSTPEVEPESTFSPKPRRVFKKRLD